jgi:hypothetical protein
MAGETRILTPDKVRKLQIALYWKAKAEPRYRFWSLYGALLNPLDHGVHGNTSGRARRGRCAEDFVIACAPGRGGEVRTRLQQWLTAKGLTRSEAKTRRVNIRQTGIHFLGFTLTWRQSARPRGYLHLEPSQTSWLALREKLRSLFHHRTHGRALPEVVKEANGVWRGWAGYFHPGHRASGRGRQRRYRQNGFRRWLWRKHAGRKSLWAAYPPQRLPTQYGWFELPATAKWQAAR